MPAASAFGAVYTQTRPMSRGRVCCVSFLVRRQDMYTADGPRAGAVRLRRLGGCGQWVYETCGLSDPWPMANGSCDSGLVLVLFERMVGDGYLHIIFVGSVFLQGAASSDGYALNAALFFYPSGQ